MIRSLIMDRYSRVIDSEYLDQELSHPSDLRRTLEGLTDQATSVETVESGGTTRVILKGDEDLASLTFQGGVPLLKYLVDSPSVNDTLTIRTGGDFAYTGPLESILADWSPVIEKFGEDALP